MHEINPFKNSELTTILVVHDIKKASSFYLDILGAELYRAYGGDSMVLKFLGNWILIVTKGGETPDKPNTTYNVPAEPNRIDHAFTIRVDDCQRSYRILCERGAQFITPPYKNGAETRCFFRDPDGHLFEISEYKE